MDQTKKTKKIRAIDTAFDVLESLMDGDQLTVTELSDRVDVSKGTVYAHLQTLRERGYVVQSEDKSYRLGLRFLAMGGHVQNTKYKRLYQHAKMEVDDLARRTGERVQVMVEEANYGVYLYQAIGDNGVWTDSYIGKRITLHATAAGKAYLASSSQARVDRILDEVGLPPHTDASITDRATFLEELEIVRDRGVAYDYGERVSGVHCVAVPIETDNGDVLGAISISAPSHRMDDSILAEFGEELTNVARVIGLNATYS